MTMVNDSTIIEVANVYEGLTAERRDFRREPEVKPLTGWRLLGVWVGMVVLSWAFVIGVVYGMWQWFIHFA